MKTLQKLGLSSALIATAAMANAGVSELTSSVNFGDVITGIFAIAGVMVGVYVAWKGAQFVLRAVRGL